MTLTSTESFYLNNFPTFLTFPTFPAFPTFPTFPPFPTEDPSVRNYTSPGGNPAQCSCCNPEKICFGTDYCQCLWYGTQCMCQGVDLPTTTGTSSTTKRTSSATTGPTTKGA